MTAVTPSSFVASSLGVGACGSPHLCTLWPLAASTNSTSKKYSTTKLYTLPCAPKPGPYKLVHEPQKYVKHCPKTSKNSPRTHYSTNLCGPGKIDSEIPIARFLTLSVARLPQAIPPGSAGSAIPSLP